MLLFRGPKRDSHAVMYPSAPKQIDIHFLFRGSKGSDLELLFKGSKRDLYEVIIQRLQEG